MRKLLTIIMFVMTAGCLYAQNGIYIKMADGRTFSFSKDNIQKLSFKSEGQMQVETKNGQTYTYNIEDIKEVPMTDKAVVTPGNAVDLGLSVMWANCNIGARQPEEYGCYYAWSETEGKEKYTHDSYNWYNGEGYTLTKYCISPSYGTVDNKVELELDDDVAYKQWGSYWRIPSSKHFDELVNKCKWEWTNVNGIKGQRVTGPNGNSIFLPAAGWIEGTEYNKYNPAPNWAQYWSSTLNDADNRASYCLSFSSGFVKVDDWFLREYGMPVRPVYTEFEEKEEFPTQPTKGDAIDMGLSVMWASCNIGATQPEEFGECYAWGETEEKESYTHKTYAFYDGTGYFKNIGSNISGTQYDVARAKLGGTWRMPTADEFQELCDKCTWRWTSHNGVFGYLVTGPSGNSIFLAPTGYKYDTESYEKGLCGSYWSTTIGNNTNEALRLSFPGAFNKKGYYLTNGGRHYGHFVRAVKD